MGKSNQVLEIIDLDKIKNQDKYQQNNSKQYIVDNEFKGLLPLNNVDIMFEDSIWDLETRYLGENSKFDFSDINYNFRDYIKLYVLEGIINSNSITTLKKNYSVLKYIIRYLDENYIFNPETITKEVTIKFSEEIMKKYKSEGERIRARRLFIYLLKKIESKTETNYRDLKLLIESKNNSKLRRAQMESGKTKNIDNKIFNKIIEIALRELNDDGLSDSEKIHACTVLILSQTGIRISDVSTLEANMIREIKGIGNEKNLKFLKFFSHKILKDYTETFLTDICYEAYKKLEELTESNREEFNSKYLFNNLRGKVVTTQTIDNYIKKFVIRNSKEIGVLNKKFDGNFIFTQKMNKDLKLIQEEKYEFLNDDYFVSIPMAHQYRVAVCNELIAKGVDFKWVKKHMGHLTSEMTMHYTRVKEEDNNKVIEGIVKGEFRLIGKEADRLTIKIKEFINEGNYNIKSDLEEIVNELSKKVPIRAKKNGYCIKSSFGKKCKNNEFMCAFEVCPNHCTSYLFADISYKRFKEGIKVIEYNNKNGFISEAVMEKNKLIRLIEDYFIKELEELKKEIDIIGYKEVILNNKNLKYLCENIDEVLREVKEWKEKNLKR